MIAFLVTIGATLADLQASTVELGSDSQERGEYIVSAPWTIKNVGTSTVTDLAVSFIGFDSEYNASAELQTTNLTENETTDVLITIFVPLNQDSGRKLLSGNIQVTGTGMSALTEQVYLETVSHLVINEVKVDVGNNRDTLKSPGKIDKDAELDDDIDFTVEVENTFDTVDKTIEIDDIELETDSDLDEADNLDDSVSNLEDGEREDLTFSFNMDVEEVDPQDAPFTITLKLSGIDENGAKHTEEWDVKLDMNVKSRDIKIIDTSLSKTILSCGDSLRIDYDLRNIGKKDTDNAMVKLEVAELDLGTWERDLSVDEGDIESFSTTLTIPDDADPGIYLLDMTAYATDSTSDDTDDKTLSFEIKKCEEEKKEPVKDDSKTDNTPIVITPNVGNDDKNTVTGTPDIVPAKPVAHSTGVSKSPLGDATTYIIVLGIIVLILLIAVVVLLARLVSK